MEEEVRIGCPVATTAAIIGGKWKSIILYYISQKNMRYSELQKLIPTISDRMLTRSLKELEEDKIINRIVHTDDKIIVEYQLTSTGKTLFPILDAMALWGIEYENKCNQASTE